MEYEPLLVGGFPRAGTRQTTDILNLHPKVQLQGEIPAKIVSSVAKLVNQVDVAHEGTQYDASYQKRRQEFIFDMLRHVCKSKPLAPAWDWGRPHLGFKKPYLESEKRSLEMLFGRMGRIRFVFCLRDVGENYLSMSSAFGTEAEQHARRTVRALRYWHRLVNDSAYTVVPMYLSDFVSASDRGEWVAQNLFEPLEIDVTIDQARAMVTKTKNKNKTPDELRRREISDEDRAKLRDFPNLLDELARFEKATGYDLGRDL